MLEIWIKVEVGEGVREMVGKGEGVQEKVRMGDRLDWLDGRQIRLGEG